MSGSDLFPFHSFSRCLLQQGPPGSPGDRGPRGPKGRPVGHINKHLQTFKNKRYEKCKAQLAENLTFSASAHILLHAGVHSMTNHSSIYRLNQGNAIILSYPPLLDCSNTNNVSHLPSCAGCKYRHHVCAVHMKRDILAVWLPGSWEWILHTRLKKHSLQGREPDCQNVMWWGKLMYKVLSRQRCGSVMNKCAPLGGLSVELRAAFHWWFISYMTDGFAHFTDHSS